MTRYHVEIITHIQGEELNIPQHWIYEGQFHRFLRANTRNEALMVAKVLNGVPGEAWDKATKEVYRSEAA
jgi:hypothetical protein